MIDLFDVEDGGRYRWTLASVHATSPLVFEGTAEEVNADRITIRLIGGYGTTVRVHPRNVVKAEEVK